MSETEFGNLLKENARLKEQIKTLEGKLEEAEGSKVVIPVLEKDLKEASVLIDTQHQKLSSALERIAELEGALEAANYNVTKLSSRLIDVEKKKGITAAYLREKNNLQGDK